MQAAIYPGNGTSEADVVIATEEDHMLMFYLPLIILEASLAMTPWSVAARKTKEITGAD